ncbi:hypothetical protein K1T73_10550 [Roseovarius sp. SCSIO 43702]|uniref:hypothetical protein n=1 Tax=Roseovarius sp. SCSIO 43702 TaxID=2823043 RepID=UPI001C73C453|nr:hypothetical protein [Roseovarius sp. SCSIO 43702]QYX55538.1 hypothetical protein K1T73_10550 [Roseovarius sp. SCSIO 43702]
MEGAKIRVKVGSMEIEYEGDPAFLDGGIETLLVTMGDLATRLPEEPAHTNSATVNMEADAPPAPKNGFNFSTNTIAAHLNANSGPELVICALAQLELVQSKSSSTRSEILAEMKGATTYYNGNMSSNMSKNLGSLTKAKRINQIAKDTYALSASERKQLEAKIADIG